MRFSFCSKSEKAPGTVDTSAARNAGENKVKTYQNKKCQNAQKFDALFRDCFDKILLTKRKKGYIIKTVTIPNFGSDIYQVSDKAEQGDTRYN